MIWASVVLIYLFLGLPPVQSFIVNTLPNLVGLIFGASLGISIAQYIIMSYVLTNLPRHNHFS